MLIDLTQAKDILGLAQTQDTDERATLYIKSVERALENFLRVKLIKTDIPEEEITMPYGMARVIMPRCLPVNSVADISVLTHKGDYVPISIPLSYGRAGIELLANFNDIQINWSQWRSMIKPTIIPAKISAVKVSYNAGLYDSWKDPAVDPLLLAVAPMILEFMFTGDLAANKKSENFGSYGYTNGEIVGGFPAAITAILDGINI